MDGRREKGGEEKGFVLQVPKSWVSLSVLAAQTGQGVAGEQDGGRRMKGGDGYQGKEVRVHNNQVWLIALDTDSF